MHLGTVLTLTRNDVKPAYTLTPALNLRIQDFKFASTFDEYRLADMVQFVDDDLTTHVIKNRMGKSGQITRID